ncbi:HvfC/BufC N-terminal domain-containing protein [Actibacterium pelagium]|uniref:DUF2063 domain-containing protein n=1 Tax=Actibacterium pelagium TaxID=2029103 RepID=A0A917AL38_9RHOB|nr:DNA-binding domain-containing protein [Actibacterium pelagium]GGE59983.1 DUF2063 domain-containing protein [Actibacterium pelagium]
MSVGQTDFTTALLDPQQAVPSGLTNPDGTPATKRFDVYRNNVVSSLLEALRTGFPVLRKLLGDEFFDAMGGLYVRSYPPTSPLMMHFGAEMPAFLAGFPPVGHLPYLPDIARLELALRSSYHAADATPADPSAMATMTPDRLMTLRLSLAPSLRVVTSDHPIVAIWRANMDLKAPKPVVKPEDALITRPEFDPRVDLLPAGGALFIAALQAGETLGEAITAAEAAAPEFDLTANLQLLLQTSAIVHISEGPQ